jgi:hypothetical protein
MGEAGRVFSTLDIQPVRPPLITRGEWIPEAVCEALYEMVEASVIDASQKHYEV